MREHIAYWLGLRRVPGLGPRRFRNLLEFFGSAEKIWQAQEKELAQVPGLGPQLQKNLLECRARLDLDKEVERIKRCGVKVVTWEDESYPLALRNIYDPPPILFVKGDLPAEMQAVAIVGTRRPTPYGKTVARELARQLSSAGWWVISGLARGIDSCAHQGALECSGKTVAVLGCGIDVVYPRENLSLYRQIEKTGALVTEFPLGTPPEAGNFPARNRIISALARGVVVVEAAESSGALITANFALEQGRDVFAVPGPITSRLSRGPHSLLKEGAKLVENAGDILEEYGIEWEEAEKADRRKKNEEAPPDFSEAERSIMGQLSLEPVAAEELTAKTGLSAAEVNASLALLEIKGKVKKLPGGWYILNL